jgi:GT2 family glycosyltransferase
MQSRPADEIIIIVRASDIKTKFFLEKIKVDHTNLRIINVSAPGQIAALNAGLAEARCDIIIFTDDDCVPSPDWLARIGAYFQADPKIGGVGGRDKLYIDGKIIEGDNENVGVITWYGKIIGNHHLGYGQERAVDHLKGSNMAFRKEAVRGISFDLSLHGEGAQYRNDLALCLNVKKNGWKIIYDPQIVVEHFYAPRFEKDQRGNFDLQAVEDGAYNETRIAIKYMSFFKRWACLAYSVLIGSLFTPGLFQFIRIAVTGERNPVARFLAAARGRRLAIWK